MDVALASISAPSSSEFFQYLFSGLTQGCLYALIALAFVTIANVTGVYNFAQGDWITIGGLVAYSAKTAGIPLAAVLILSMLAVAGVALAQERLTVAPIRTRAGMLGLVVATLGVGVVIRGAALAIWGKDNRGLPSFNDGIFKLLGAYLTYQTVWVWSATAIALVLMLGLFIYTDVGRAMRACAANPAAARLIGIRVGRMSMIAFALGGALSGLIGAIIVPITGARWDSGLALGLVGFIAAALARFTNPFQSVVFGLLLGVIQNLAAGIISSAYSTAILYSVLIVYLVGRGLFGAEGTLRRLGHRRQTASARAAVRRLPRPTLATARKDDVGHAVAAEQTTPALDRKKATVVTALLGLAIAMPWILSGDTQARDAAVFTVLAAIGATGLSLALGLAGQFSLGQGAFYLIGGYGSALLTTKAHWPFLAALIAAAGLSVLGGLVLGALTLRLEGFNLAIATLAFHLILLIVVGNWLSLTGGPLGVSGMAPLKALGINFADQAHFYWLSLAVLVVCLVVARNIARSALGRSLRAVALDEPGATSLGFNPVWLKLVVLGVGGAMAGVAGSLWAGYLQYAAPTNWDFTITIALVAFVIVGGTSSVYGGALGAITVGALQYVATGGVSAGLGGGSSATKILINGVLILVVMLLLPGGLASLPATLRGLRDGPRRTRLRRVDTAIGPKGVGNEVETAP